MRQVRGYAPITLRLADADKKPILTLSQKPGDTTGLSYGDLEYNDGLGAYIRFKENTDTDQTLFSIGRNGRPREGLRTIKAGAVVADHLCVRINVNTKPEEENGPEKDLDSVGKANGYKKESTGTLKIDLK